MRKLVLFIMLMLLFVSGINAAQKIDVISFDNIKKSLISDCDFVGLFNCINVSRMNNSEKNYWRASDYYPAYCANIAIGITLCCLPGVGLTIGGIIGTAIGFLPFVAMIVFGVIGILFSFLPFGMAVHLKHKWRKEYYDHQTNNTTDGYSAKASIELIKVRL